MRVHVLLHPAGKGFVAVQAGFKTGIGGRQPCIGRVYEVGGHAGQFGIGNRGRAIFEISPFSIDLAAKLVNAQRLHQNLDTGLVRVIAAAFQVIDADDCFHIREQVTPRQRIVNHFTQNRRTAQAATDPDAGQHITLGIFVQMQTDVVHLHHGTITLGTMHSDLELTRQESEFRMEGAPLADDFSERTRVDHFVRGDTGELVAGHIPNTVTRRLDGMHFHVRQTFQYVRHAIHRNPVVLQIVARCEVGIALVFFAGDRA